MKYDNESLAAMCSKFDLLGYMQDKYKFIFQGGHYYCKCPFHLEATPSCMVENNRYYCFGCGAQGGPIDAVRNIENLSFNDAVDKIAQMTGSEVKRLKSCEMLKFFKEVKRIKEKPVKEVTHTILDDDFYTKFSDEIPSEWLEEGMSARVIKKYEIRVDSSSNRIVYPVYDTENRLIGVKGRTRFSNHKDLGIAKYMNYTKVGVVDYFMGWKQNYSTIQKNKACIIFEGIKSVMKLDDFSSQIGLAAETSCLNDEQVHLLIKSGIKDITIAFDSDVKKDKIIKCTEKLRRFANVYVIQDRHHLLKEKESPVDEGKEVWEILYKERERIC